MSVYDSIWRWKGGEKIKEIYSNIGNTGILVTTAASAILNRSLGVMDVWVLSNVSW